MDAKMLDGIRAKGGKAIGVTEEKAAERKISKKEKLKYEIL